MQTKKYNYNFSIITPGGCSSKCDFCTDPFNEKFSNSYMEDLVKAIKLLPKTFNQVSVTGGEPTQSPLFNEILDLLFADKLWNKHFDKCVLTTNGWKLDKFIGKIGKVFNHVNISRHGIGDEANFKVFGGKNIATDLEIQNYTSFLCQVGVDTNLNHVYNEGLSIEYVREYIKYAKSLYATKVTFRFDQNKNQMEQSYLEKAIAEYYIQVESGGCPVCREACYLIDGMYVTFKNSCAEPTQQLGGELYELIYHPDGKLYKDWGKKMPYKLEQPVVFSRNVGYTPKSSRGSSGCGSGGC